ncbi:MAG: hypothetical protein ABGX83_05520 [Nitrospira sp.]
MSNEGLSSTYGGDASPAATPQVAGGWRDGAKITDPGAGSVMKSHTFPNTGEYFLQFLMKAQVQAKYDIQHRNVGDTATLHSFEVDIPPNLPVDLLLTPGLTFLKDELIKVVNVNAYTGVGQVSILDTELVG